MDFSECMTLLRAPGQNAVFPVIEHAVAVPCTRTASTLTEAYVQTVVECMDVIDVEAVNLQPLLEELAKAHTRSPVLPDDIEAATVHVDGLYRAMYKRTPNFMPRVLKTLNGEDFKLVPTDVLHVAADREKAMSGMVHGWGVCDPPPYAVAYRLLASCGLDVRRLPTYKAMPPAQRGRLMCAWAGACRQLGWSHHEPKADVAARARTARDLDAFVQKASSEKNDHRNVHAYE